MTAPTLSPCTTSVLVRPGRPVVLVVLAALLAAAAVAGAALAGRQLLAPVRTSADGVSVVRTSFGSATVGTAEAVPVLTASAMGGMTHAAPQPGGAVQVQVPVTLVNESAAPVVYSPDQFRLTAGATSAPAVVTPLLSGTLRPGAAVSLRVGFTLDAAVPTARLSLDPLRRDVAVDVPVTSVGTPLGTPPAPAAPHSTH